MKVLCLMCHYYHIEWIDPSVLNTFEDMDQVVNEDDEDNQNRCLANNANGTVDNSADESSDMDVEQAESIILYYTVYIFNIEW